MIQLRSIALAIFLLLATSVVLHAQAPAALPPGMTQEQFDTLVDSISKSVAERLKAEGVVASQPTTPAAKSGKGSAAPKAAAAPKPKLSRTEGEEAPDEFAVFLGQAQRVAQAVPALGTHLAAIPGLLDEREKGGRGAAGFLLLLGLVAVVAVTAEAALRKILGQLRERLAVGATPEFGLRSLLHLASLAVLDALGLLVVWLISHGAIGAWFSDATGQDKLAAAVLAGIFSWRLYVFVFRVVLQPGLPTARLCDVGDHDSRAMYARISVVMLLIILGRILFRVLAAISTPMEALMAYQAIGAVVYVAAFVWLVVRSKEAARQWLVGLGKVAPLVGFIGHNWTTVAVPFFVALGATQIYGAVSGRAHVSSAMSLTLTLVVGVLIFETLLQAFVRRLDSQLVGRTPAGDVPKLPDVAARCLRVAVLIVVALAIAQSWVVEVLDLVNENEWGQLTRSSRTAGITLFMAFVLWEFFKYATAPYMDQKTAGGSNAAADGDGATKGASRLGTLMPLLRVTMAIVIGLLAVLIALESFDVNITPLLAGASVLGLAVSFGSQTLVRDIVSGIFYLSDDAFRVGEYIDCGKAKGTVEGFTLRSLKLRHQNGQVHTIPFGQLGQITNFSRDWTTVKFNMRFVRDTDVEILRKAAKKIGAEMMEMPEFKDEILAPFKMQGVADIAGNALLVRFKFTAKPGNPSSIQREAIKRLFRTLPELGIEFASEGATVVLQTNAGQPDGASAAAGPSGPQAQPGGPMAISSAA